MNCLLMADNNVGLAITLWLLDKYRADLALIVTTCKNEIYSVACDLNIPCYVFKSTEQICSCIDELSVKLDIGILAWWPKLIRPTLLSIPTHGFINTHPSLLPYNRGKHYNFWALVEQAPFGVSLHFVGDGIDNGDIVAQDSLHYDWEDNGETLYRKAGQAMVNLFKKTYPVIRTLNIPRQKQDLSCGSFHLAAELEKASFIDIAERYRARDLLNLIRARTFSGYPACWFTDAGEAYEVRLKITRKK